MPKNRQQLYRASQHARAANHPLPNGTRVIVQGKFRGEILDYGIFASQPWATYLIRYDDGDELRVHPDRVLPA